MLHYDAEPLALAPPDFVEAMENSILKCIETCGCDQDDFLDQLANNQKLAALGRLSADVIQEVNTPLCVIVSAAQLILQESELPAPVLEMAERICFEAQRLSHLSRGVLSLVREDSAAMGEVDVNEVLRDVLAFVECEARNRSILVMESLDYSVPPVLAKSNYLKQIFVNLVMSVVQAMECGGCLTVATSVTPGGQVEIRISDHGPGIPAAVSTGIFAPYLTTKKIDRETVLDLFVTRKLVESLHGQMWHQAAAGEGTAFTVQLPSYV